MPDLSSRLDVVVEFDLGFLLHIGGPIDPSPACFIGLTDWHYD
jgi:hypothetical protein